MASRVASVVKRHPQITFFVLAYAVAWAFVPFGSFGAFGPLVAALIVVPLTRGWAGLRDLGSRSGPLAGVAGCGTWWLWVFPWRSTSSPPGCTPRPATTSRR